MKKFKESTSWLSFIVIGILLSVALVGFLIRHNKEQLEIVKEKEAIRIEHKLKMKNFEILNKASYSFVFGDWYDLLYGEYEIIHADGSRTRKKIDSFETKNLTADSQVNNTMLDAWYQKEENKVSEIIKEAEKQFLEEKNSTREIFNSLKTDEDRSDMATFNKTFIYSVLVGGSSDKTIHDPFLLKNNNSIKIYYNKKTDSKLISEVVGKLLEKIDKKEYNLYNSIQFVEVSSANQFELEDAHYDGNVKLIITDKILGWRKIIDIDNVTRFIDALEFFKNPNNKK